MKYKINWFLMFWGFCSGFTFSQAIRTSNPFWFIPAIVSLIVSIIIFIRIK